MIEFRLSKRKIGIYCFEVKDNQLVYVTNDSLYEKAIFIDDELLLNTNVTSFVKQLNSYIVFGTWSPDIYIYNNGLKNILGGYSLSENKYDENKIIVSKKISRGIYKPFVYDLEKNQITQELRNGFLKKFSDIELFQNQNTLSLLTGEYEWETDLGGRYYLSANEQQEAKISQIIGIIDDKLYVWMNDDRLVVLAIATGTILSETFPLQNFKDNGIVKYVLLPQYRESEQSLLFFYQDFLITIHLPTQTTSLVWQDDRYNIGPSFITDHSIYFIVSCEKGALFRDHVGVFDREKNEVVWMQQVIKLSKKSYNNLKEIQASDDKIYVLDTEGTLYIFEKGYDSI